MTVCQSSLSTVGIHHMSWVYQTVHLIYCMQQCRVWAHFTFNYFLMVEHLFYYLLFVKRLDRTTFPFEIYFSNIRILKKIHLFNRPVHWQQCIAPMHGVIIPTYWNYKYTIIWAISGFVRLVVINKSCCSNPSKMSIQPYANSPYMVTIHPGFWEIWHRLLQALTRAIICRRRVNKQHGNIPNWYSATTAVGAFHSKVCQGPMHITKS